MSIGRGRERKEERKEERNEGEKEEEEEAKGSSCCARPHRALPTRKTAGAGFSGQGMSYRE